jgi:hypothetical protein
MKSNPGREHSIIHLAPSIKNIKTTNSLIWGFMKNKMLNVDIFILPTLPTLFCLSINK